MTNDSREFIKFITQIQPPYTKKPDDIIKESGWPYLVIWRKKRFGNEPTFFPSKVATELAKKAQQEVYKAKKQAKAYVYAFMSFDHTDHNKIVLTTATQEETDILRSYFLNNEHFELVYA